MTERKAINTIGITDNNFKKLSIQVSLNGLSFCVIDSITNSILITKNITFPNEYTPQEVLSALKIALNEQAITTQKFSDVIVTHKNNLFSLVPLPLFNENDIGSYLNYNAKIFANDHIAFDKVNNQDLISVYVPLVNINNYIYELFGEFTFKHTSTIQIQTLLNTPNTNKELTCYAHVSKDSLDITILKDKKLIFHNSFEYLSTEDFIYYLLFTFEQLNLDPETIPLMLFGSINPENSLYKQCYKYIKNVSIFSPPTQYIEVNNITNAVDFTVLNAI